MEETGITILLRSIVVCFIFLIFHIHNTYKEKTGKPAQRLPCGLSRSLSVPGSGFFSVAVA